MKKEICYEIKMEYDEKIKNYYEKIRFIDAVFDVFYSMRYGDKRWDNLYGISPVYFTVVRKSLGYYFIIGLCNFFESHIKSGFNINKFIKEIKNSYNKYDCSLPKEVDEFQNYINDKHELIDKLMKHRDKYIAHFDKEYFLGEKNVSDEAPLYPEEIREMIEKTLEFIGKINFIISNEITFVSYYYKDDYKKLFALYEKSIQ